MITKRAIQLLIAPVLLPTFTLPAAKMAKPELKANISFILADECEPGSNTIVFFG